MNDFNCQQAREELDREGPGAGAAVRSEDLQRHLGTCPACGRVSERLAVLRNRLATLPPPTMPEGFEDRVRQRFRPAARGMPLYAMAASVLLCVCAVLGLARYAAPESAISTSAVSVPARETHSVRLVFNSPRDLRGVSLTVALPEGVELAQRPGVRELTWTADLRTGSNVLELPVLADQPGAQVVATLRYGNAERRYEVAVGPRLQSGGPSRVSARVASSRTPPAGVRLPPAPGSNVA